MPYCLVMRLQAISLFFVLAAGCGGGTSEPEVVFVDELSTGDQIDLCEQFLDLFCAVGSPGEALCDDPCINTACQAAAENGDIDAECMPGDVTTEEVLDCGADATAVVCGEGGTNGPGCVADALTAACGA